MPLSPQIETLSFSKNLTTLPIAIVVLIARSNRIQHLEPLVPELLKALNHLPPKVLRTIGAESAKG